MLHFRRGSSDRFPPGCLKLRKLGRRVSRAHQIILGHSSAADLEPEGLERTHKSYSLANNRSSLLHAARTTSQDYSTCSKKPSSNQDVQAPMESCSVQRRLLIVRSSKLEVVSSRQSSRCSHVERVSDDGIRGAARSGAYRARE